jgi:hypothetical protein
MSVVMGAEEYTIDANTAPGDAGRWSALKNMVAKKVANASVNKSVTREA